MRFHRHRWQYDYKRTWLPEGGARIRECEKCEKVEVLELFRAAAWSAT